VDFYLERATTRGCAVNRSSPSPLYAQVRAVPTKVELVSRSSMGVAVRIETVVAPGEAGRRFLDQHVRVPVCRPVHV